jgi:phosphorylase/glycogen(starch) synthase
MMETEVLKPDWIFETSWEVCNKVGGIHTVLSSKAELLVDELHEQYVTIGPDLNPQDDNPEFTRLAGIYEGFEEYMKEQGVPVRIGKWNIPSSPVTILVDFKPAFAHKDQILTNLWSAYKIDSLHGGWDYVEPVVFAYTVGKVIDAFHRKYINKSEQVVAHFHEWMCGAGALYLKQHNPLIATLFTTHATMMGRAMAGNGYPLYSMLEDAKPFEIAEKINIRSKHSMESNVAFRSDAFTTVSEITAKECEFLLGKKPDFITPNGFNPEHIAKDSAERKKKRIHARKKLAAVASAVTGASISEDAFFIFKSGRFEYHNKGIDIFLSALKSLEADEGKQVVAFVLIPAGHGNPMPEVLSRLKGENVDNEDPGFLTHGLDNAYQDPIYRKVIELELNKLNNNVHIVYAPVYLNGNDGVFNEKYYDLLTGADLGVFPSYYEPWGYTPLESIAAGVPTITTSLAGFGKWVNTHHTKQLGKSVEVIVRHDHGDSDAARALTHAIERYVNLGEKERASYSKNAGTLAKSFSWVDFVVHYRKAYSKALHRSQSRKLVFDKERVKQSLHQITIAKDHDSAVPEWRKLFVEPKLPEELEGLRELAWNLWTYWNRDARDLFRTIDEKDWDYLKQNPVALLEAVSYKHLLSLTRNKSFMGYYNDILNRYRGYMKARPKKGGPKIAYLCMEYGLDPLLRLYSGGLGVLAGDYIKEASDSGVDMTAIGLLYRNGYFKQTFNEHGNQIAVYKKQKFTFLPLIPVRNENGEWLKLTLDFPGHQVYAKVWKVQVGSVNLYLLDTDIDENSSEDKAITAELYGGEWENRLKQEFLLGVGGIQLLNKLNIEPDIYHLNEGHAAFAGIERIRQLVQEKGLNFGEAVEVVRSCSLFTTHTPVPAGHDVFSEDYMRKYFGHFPEKLGISWNAFMGLGKSNALSPDEPFSVSHLAMHLSQEVNGVSRLHGEVTRDIFKHIYPGYFKEEMPFGYVTNGAHYPTHAALEMSLPLRNSNNDEFFHHERGEENWTIDITDKQLWSVRKRLKQRLIHFLKENMKRNLSQEHQSPKYIMQVNDRLTDDALVIGFARRFATYKRATLIFSDLDRLRAMLNQPDRPVVLLFSGKAHPKDKPGQDLIKRVIEISRMPEFLGKVIFLENYNMYVARYLVSGSDVWLNNPTRPLEASGTSGIKACFNGVLNLSVLDGWWDEGHVEGAGWALPKEKTYDFQQFQDELDAETIYSIIEKEIIPEFFERNSENVPEKWIGRVRKTVAKIVPEFTMHRMLEDYQERYYNPLMESNAKMTKNNNKLAKDLAKWKLNVRNHWKDINVMSMNVFDSTNESLEAGGSFSAEIVLNIPGLKPEDVGVEMVFIQRKKDNSDVEIHNITELEITEVNKQKVTYSGMAAIDKSGVYEYGFRIFPKNEAMRYRQEMPLVRWV